MTTYAPVNETRKVPRPQIVVGLLLIAGAFPFRFGGVGGHTVSLYDVTLLVVLVPYMLVSAVATDKPKLPRGVLRLGLASVVLSVASLLWTEDQNLTLFNAVSCAEAVLTMMIVVTMLRDAPPRQIIRLMYRWVYLLLIPAVLLWQHTPGFLPPSNIDPTSGDYISYFVRLSHPFIGRSNNLAALLVFFIVPLAVWSMRTGDRRAAFGSLVALVATALTFSRGALIALVVAVLLYTFIEGRIAWRLIRRGLLGAVLILIVVECLLTLSGTAATFLPDRLSLTTVDARGGLLTQARSVFNAHWLLGIGGGVGGDVHNTYIQQFIYVGLLAGTVMCWLFIRAGRWWFQKEHGDALWISRAIGVGVVAQLLSFLGESSYEGTLLRPLVWVTWSLGVALVYSVQRQPALKPAKAPSRPYSGTSRTTHNRSRTAHRSFV